jgi:hypothetical protein
MLNERLAMVAAVVTVVTVVVFVVPPTLHFCLLSDSRVVGNLRIDVQGYS